jgi:hypothetical protein
MLMYLLGVAADLGALSADGHMEQLGAQVAQHMALCLYPLEQHTM